MLNYVWLGLIVLGIGAAISTDIIEKNQNKYNNGNPVPAYVIFKEGELDKSAKSQIAEIVILSSDFNRFYGEKIDNDIKAEVKTTYSAENDNYAIFLEADDKSPKIWREMAKASGKEKDLMGVIRIEGKLDSNYYSCFILFEEISFVKMRDVTNAALEFAGTAVNIALGLIGIMALWLGVMKVAEEAGLIYVIARALRPLTKFLFPKIPTDHPAVGSMIMNISANMLGLSNAATPFGLKAMEELDKLNPNKGTASNEMCTFLAINTAGLTLIPTTAIAIRAAAGSSNPAIIIGTTMFAAVCATITAIIAVKIFENFSSIKNDFRNWFSERLKFFIALLIFIIIVVILIASGAIHYIFSVLDFINLDLVKDIIQVVSIVAIPAIIFLFLMWGFLKKIKVYEKFIEGAKEGFNVAIKIIPYLVAMLAAIAIFRAGGAMNFLVGILTPVTSLIGMPADVLPMALMRPLSGSGSLGIMAEIMAQFGADSIEGVMASTFFGSTETTFYVLALYFGSVGIVKTRHALPVGLIADTAGILAAVFIVNLLFG